MTKWHLDGRQAGVPTVAHFSPWNLRTNVAARSVGCAGPLMANRYSRDKVQYASFSNYHYCEVLIMKIKYTAPAVLLQGFPETLFMGEKAIQKI
ncbi:MAG: hypothetical protein H7Y22_16490 [Gemmatimonadaceae bacterium]|nr:hypothetical protein [Gloeobacterales cyanobacterium ES-bin-141]